ncbi:hypothetical protein [Cohnella lupini]|uniref:Uncharacterized protein n=1 Tax=Cohnella lupini TaxID=1294267 RepID=A0A3D9I745_9BACL|nr:hypothetical protein [Cohnella lupini]RED57577.1 hypothetical protein DFP95_11050 [Cohnella lupini]
MVGFHGIPDYQAGAIINFEYRDSLGNEVVGNAQGINSSILIKGGNNKLIIGKGVFWKIRRSFSRMIMGFALMGTA